MDLAVAVLARSHHGITYISACSGCTTALAYLSSTAIGQSTQMHLLVGCVTSLCEYGLVFLLAHFVWAFSLMFLWSGRGYWQELIESIGFMG